MTVSTPRISQAQARYLIRRAYPSKQAWIPCLTGGGSEVINNAKLIHRNRVKLLNFGSNADKGPIGKTFCSWRSPKPTRTLILSPLSPSCLLQLSPFLHFSTSPPRHLCSYLGAPSEIKLRSRISNDYDTSTDKPKMWAIILILHHCIALPGPSFPFNLRLFYCNHHVFC